MYDSCVDGSAVSDSPAYRQSNSTGTIDFLSRQRRWSAEMRRLRASAKEQPRRRVKEGFPEAREVFPVERFLRSSARGTGVQDAGTRCQERATLRAGQPRKRKGYFGGSFLLLMAVTGIVALVFGTDRFPTLKAKGLELVSTLRAIEARAHTANAADIGDGIVSCADQAREPMLLGTELSDGEIADAEISMSLGTGGTGTVSERQRLAEERLSRLGAARGKLTGWGTGLWRYSCTVGGHHYEAIAPAPAEALERVAEKISHARR